MAIILIVDDDDNVRDILYELLSEKYECHTVSTADEALEYLEVEEYAAIFTDIEMSGLDGISLLKQLQQRDSDTPVIMISGKIEEQDKSSLVEMGAFAVISKPFSLEDVAQTAERAVTRKQSPQS